MVVLIGDEEEAKRWNSRFTSERTEAQLNTDVNSPLAATSNIEKVIELFR